MHSVDQSHRAIIVSQSIHHLPASVLRIVSKEANKASWHLTGSTLSKPLSFAFATLIFLSPSSNHGFVIMVFFFCAASSSSPALAT
jgi:hypothetical protein